MSCAYRASRNWVTADVPLSIPIFARRDDFVGQVGNLRRIVNPPAASKEAAARFAACRSVGQVANRRCHWIGRNSIARAIAASGNARAAARADPDVEAWAYVLRL